MSGAWDAMTGGGANGSLPSYDENLARQSQTNAAKRGIYGVNSSLGGLTTRINPDGTVSKVYTDSVADTQRNKLIQSGLGALSLDPTQAQNAYYNQATRLLNPQMERQTASLDENLINRGIGIGSEQYKNSMGDLRNQQSGQLSDIANQAVFKGQGLPGSQIQNINQLSQGRDIGALAGMSGRTNATSTYDNKFNYDTQAQQAQAQQNQAQLNGIMGMGGAIAGAFSDKRLKENLKPVAKLKNGLTIYLGNYTKESGLDMTPQLFLIAQEVEKINKEAVGERDGFKTVRYEMAVK